MPEAKFKAARETLTTPKDVRQRVHLKVKQPALVAEIIEVSWKSGIDTAREKAKIILPHWKKGDEVKEDDNPKRQKYPTGSKKPGVYLVKSKGGSDLVAVKINVTKSENQDPTADLKGLLGSLRLEGQCPTAVGVHEVTLKIINLPDTLEHYEGDASWTLATPKVSISLTAKTRLELFVILAKPAAFYLQGAWAEALRFVFKKVKIAGFKDAAQVAEKVTGYCHTKHDMRYDTVRGAGNFGGSSMGSEIFQLLKYISWSEFPLTKPNIYGDKKNNIVNCYDQAAAVQALCGIVGVKTQWVFALPYGFIKTSNLVGVGNCNNPFFKNPAAAPRPVVDKNDPARSPFGNHAYLQLLDKMGNVLDACAGPHTGSENMQTYLQNAIDADRSITIPSFLDDIENQTGVRPRTASEYHALVAKILRRPGGIPEVE